MKKYASINPFTEAKLQEYSFIHFDEANQLLNQSIISFQLWRKKSFDARAKPIIKLSELLIENADSLARIASEEMGKIVSQARSEIIKSANLCAYYAIHSGPLLEPEIHQIEEETELRISFEPLGVILGIYPWNFPFWQIIRSAAPILMSGNVILVKPAPNVPQTSLALQKIIDQCGFPEGTFRTIFADEELVANLISDDRIAGTTLTGSEDAGSKVAAQSGKYIKPHVLELGGSDPCIILKDAPLDELMEQIVFARFQNNGQSCVAAKRFLVQAEIAEEFIQKLITAMDKLVLGNPLLPETHIGPLARFDLVQLLVQQVNDSVAAGAKMIYQSKQKPLTGFFFPPTILSNIPKDSRAYREELFGPVVSLYSFETMEEAIELANDSRFGLGACIFSKDLDLAKKMANQIESGMVSINQIVKSDSRFPFGGIKKSGYGREIGEYGLKAFCNVKTVWLKKL